MSGIINTEKSSIAPEPSGRHPTDSSSLFPGKRGELFPKMISGNDKEACVRELRPCCRATRRTLFCFYFHICMHTLHKQPIHLYRRAQINTATVEMITHTHWSQSRAASYQVGDGWRMRSVLGGIQTLWKRPVVVSRCL